MMGQRGGGHPVPGRDIAAGQLASRRNRFVNPQPRRVRQRLGNSLNLRVLHKWLPV